jgi:hypothetical protein
MAKVRFLITNSRNCGYGVYQIGEV